ncbi:MAG: histidine phosphatase family protein [Isosphaeraceae bacterium]|nr:histidine phosphatase family protein [Isosphaeraceae bacterium]
MTTIVYLVRHGATAANLDVPYRLQGRGLDLPLDAAGRSQAEAASRALAIAGVEVAAVVASPLLRSRETAEIIAEPRGLEVVVESDLIEADLGRWENLTWDQAQALDPEHHDRFHAAPGTVPYPGGESFLDVQRRVTPALARTAAAYAGRSIVVIGHNVTCRAYLAGLLGIPIDRARAIRQANGGINVIRYDGEKPTVVTVNACLHLGPTSVH